MNSKQKKKKRQQLIEKFGCYCWWCGECLRQEILTIEHLIPRSRGGSDSIENLRLSCFECNNSRGNSLYPPSWEKGKCS